MNFLTHLLSILLLGKILHLTRQGWILAIVFGMLIDLDHLAKLRIYYKPKHWGDWHKPNHLNWRTPLQEPVSYLWVIPVSIFLNSYIPIIFFTLHLALDYMMSFQKKPFFPFNNFTIRDNKKFKRDIILQIAVSVALCIFLIK